MKRFIFLGLIVVVLAGCSFFTGAIYGPDLTPAQLTDAVYEDAYSIGAIMAAREGADPAALISKAQALQGAIDPEASLREAWLSALRDGDVEHGLLWFAVRRIYSRLGVQIVDDQLQAAGIDLELFNLAVGAFIDGVGQI